MTDNLRRCFFIGLSCLIMPLKAQITTDTVEVMARRLSESERSAAPMQSISQTEMQRLGVTAVSDAVRHMAGVQVKDYGGIGGLKTVSVRGLGAQHTAVMYDGVAISDCQTGQIDISRYAIDNVENLSLTIGQDDNIFQTAKQFASAGVLNINTHSLSTQSKASVRAGSYGLVNPTLLLRTFINSRLHISAFADYLRADGNYKFHMMNGKKSIDEKRNNSQIESWKGELNLAYLITDRQTLRLKAYLYDCSRGLPGNVVYDNTYAAEHSHDKNYFGQLNYENKISDKWKLQANVKFDWYWNKYTNKTVAEFTDDRFRQTAVYANATVWHQPLSGLSFSFAQDFEYNYLHSNLEHCPFPSRYTLLSVLASHYTNEWLTATASLLNTYITENVELGTAADDRHRLSPAFSISVKPLRDINWRLRASYKDIFRNPTFNDLYYVLLGNRNLRPEKTKQVNVGTIWNSSFKGAIDYVSLSLDAYYGRVEDKIVAIPKMFFWTMFNVGKVETHGLDATLNVEAKLAKDIRLYAMATYNYMKAIDITDKTSSIWHNQLPYTPKHSGSGSLTIETPVANLSYNLIWTGARYSLQQNAASNRIKPYQDHSVSLYRTFNIGKTQLKLQADALNLGNKNYEVVRFYPMPGRNYKFTATVIF